MSAKGRGAEVVSEENYPTPKWVTRRILEALPQLTCHRATWLEPCAGEGAIVNVVRQHVSDCYIDTGDIRSGVDPEESDRHVVMSFTGWDTRHDVVITNPPFSLAPELIAHFLPRCDWLILLLRASFKLASSGGKDRAPYSYRDNMPDEYKLPQRPSFIASEKCKGHNVRDGGCGWSRKVALTVEALRACPHCGGKVQRSESDSSEYSWFVWTPERGRSAGLTRVLPDTSLEERKAG